MEHRLDIEIIIQSKKLQLHILFAIAKKFAAQTRKFCAAIPPQIIFCDFCVANFAAQIWRKNAQKGAKNPRKRKQFLRFCAAIPPQIFAHGNPIRLYLTSTGITLSYRAVNFQ